VILDPYDVAILTLGAWKEDFLKQNAFLLPILWPTYATNRNCWNNFSRELPTNHSFAVLTKSSKEF